MLISAAAHEGSLPGAPRYTTHKPAQLQPTPAAALHYLQHLPVQQMLWQQQTLQRLQLLLLPSYSYI
jgi:hypothetical protein